MRPPLTLMDSQRSGESSSPKEDQKVGPGGWTLGRDGGKPILQMRKEKHREGQGSARTQSPWTLESGLHPEAPAAFPLRGSRPAGEQEGTVLPAGMNGWLLGMCWDPDEASPEPRKGLRLSLIQGLRPSPLPPAAVNRPRFKPSPPLRPSPTFIKCVGGWGRGEFFQYVKHLHGPKKTCPGERQPEDG